MKALTLLLLLAAAASIAQTGTMPALNTTGIVALVTDEASTNGSGFVVGATDDSLFVVTARHVVMPNGKISPDIKVAFNDNVFTNGNVLFVHSDTSDLYDIALVGIRRKNEQLPRYSTIANITPGCDVFFYRSKGITRLPGNDLGTIVNWEDEDHMMYSVYLAGIKGGDSGSALFSAKGIVGMIIGQDRYYGSVLNINHIKKVISSWNDKYWQLGTLDQ